MFADVIVDISAESVDRPFQYLIPDRLKEEIRPGTPVIIPFGTNRNVEGFVVGVGDTPKLAPEKIKPIYAVNDKGNRVDAGLIELAWWMKEQFGSTMNEALRTVVPVKKKVREIVHRTIHPAMPEAELKEYYCQAVRRHYVAKSRLVGELIEQGSLPYELVTGKLNVSSSVITKLESECVIRVEEEHGYRDRGIRFEACPSDTVELNEAQRGICDSIESDIDNGVRRDYLLYGVTGSGKTEVYMDIIGHVIDKGKKVIMLIPEISLTYQTVKRFYSRFGDRISVMNSKLSAGERYDQYLKARRGETDIVIGPRSALFTPFEDIGLIIIDEEHETSYKSENAPRYHAREVALKRAELTGASCIFGSATPSLESYTMALAGRMKLFTLDKRAGNAGMPDISVVDMREELKARNRSMFSRQLQRLIGDKLEKHEQTMLFLNRRGYTGSVTCRNCGKTIKCPHCDISLTLHNDGNMMCHYCGYTEPKAKVCPSCGSPYIGSFGIGTQKVEELLKEMYPTARVVRMDADSTKSKTSYENILSSFANEEADIMIGTQMIVKGHDFPKVSLVGILLADMSLFSSDFRSAERTFELLTQASGRAGRKDIHGDVVIQTYNPEHYSIVKAQQADYEGFYREEFDYRRFMGYPPSRTMLSVLILSKDEQMAGKVADNLKGFISKVRSLYEQSSADGGEKTDRYFKMIGPSDAPLAKANDLFRRIIYIKAGDYALLVRIKDAIAERCEQAQDTRFSIEFNFN